MRFQRAAVISGGQTARFALSLRGRNRLLFLCGLVKISQQSETNLPERLISIVNKMPAPYALQRALSVSSLADMEMICQSRVKQTDTHQEMKADANPSKQIMLSLKLL